MSVVWAADDAGLSQSEHRLFSRIYRRYNAKRGCDESLPEMAKGCKMHKDTAKSVKDRLLALQMITETPRSGRSSRLDVVSPEYWLCPDNDTDPPETKGTPSNTPPKRRVGYPPETKGDEVYTEGNTVEEEARANLDTLPPGVRRYADQIHAAFALDTDARRQFAYRALKAGLMPAPELTHQLDAAAASHGDLALVAALVVTDNDAEARYPKQRTAFFESVLSDIAGHRRRAALPPSADTPETDRAPEALPHPMEHLTRKQAAALARRYGLSLDADTYAAGETRGGIPLVKFRIERLIQAEAVTEAEALAKQHRPS